MHHRNPRDDGPILPNYFELSVCFHIFDVIFEIAKIQRMRMMDAGQFRFMNIDLQ
jgi:hypothetical protein